MLGLAKQKKSGATLGGIVLPPEKILAEDLKIKKPEVFAKFLRWYALPGVLRGKPRNLIEKAGISDPETLDLLEIKSQKDFGEKFKLGQNTVTEWKQKVVKAEIFGEAKDFFKSLTPNIYGAFYLKALHYADAPRVRLWEEIFHGKAPEGQPTAAQPNVVQQTKIETVIINLGKEYEEKLHTAYEQIIDGQDEGQVQGDERVRSCPPSQSGHENSGSGTLERGEETNGEGNGAKRGTRKNAGRRNKGRTGSKGR